jgi:hypothetical protein
MTDPTTETAASTTGPIEDMTVGADRDGESGADTAGAVPVSPARVRNCLNSAGFWVSELPRYADKEQRWADVLAVASAIVASITGLSIWPLLETGTDVGKAIFSAGALFAALLAALPRIFNFAEMAGGARELASRYGAIVGDLVDLDALNGNYNQSAALMVVTEFEATKAKKDNLRRLPDKDRVIAKRRATRADSPA